MPSEPWLIYGAYGYTGTLVAEEAVRRGYRPVLAGRSADRLAVLAKRLELEYRASSLQDEEALSRALAGFKLVFHAAGPFVHTSGPMVRACLKAGAHYVDICGEAPVIERSFSYDVEARQKGIVILSGAGFDVIPTDCLAKYVADRVPGATELELAVAALGRLSPGTVKTILEQIPSGTRVLRNGRLVGYHPEGKGARRIRFVDKERPVAPVSMADLIAAYRTTGIPNITTYLAFPETTIRLMRWTEPLSRNLLAVGPIRRLAQKTAGKIVRGPDEPTRLAGGSHLWARAANDKGEEAEAWLETVEAYRFTSMAAVRCVERVLEERPCGALTPAQAFGADFVLQIPETKRYDRLEEVSTGSA